MSKRHGRRKHQTALAVQKKKRYNVDEVGRLDRIEKALEIFAEKVGQYLPAQLDNLIMQNVTPEG